MKPLRDEFLSEEDLDLRNLSDDELVAYWSQWLVKAQATNEADADTCTHGVFALELPWHPRARALARLRIQGGNGESPRDRKPWPRRSPHPPRSTCTRLERGGRLLRGRAPAPHDYRLRVEVRRDDASRTTGSCLMKGDIRV